MFDQRAFVLSLRENSSVILSDDGDVIAKHVGRIEIVLLCIQCVHMLVRSTHILTAQNEQHSDILNKHI